jgi:two-component sensor histidine kinase
MIPVAQTLVTDQLLSRAAASPDYLREKLALQDLARYMSDEPSKVLSRLVHLAMELCEAGSAGVSILERETNQFRWFGLAGVLSVFEGEKTPRNNSPCGICLDIEGPVLMERPERAFDWIRDAGISVPEVLLVPLSLSGLDAIGTLWVVSDAVGHFNSGHARMLTELASFAAMALRMIQTEEQLHAALQQQEVLTREMSHRVKNLFSLMAGMVRMSRRGAISVDDLADKLVGRITALSDAHALVRRQFADGAPAATTLADIVDRILRPYGQSRWSIGGPGLPVGEKATNSLALIFHELATNAAKYGALSTEDGSVSVEWTADEHEVALIWQEVGGPTVGGATGAAGFGTRLIETTVQSAGGAIDYQWKSDGLTVQLRLPLSALKI